MKTARYSKSRQKACQPCSNAKAKCDRNERSCGRCVLRGLACTYPPAASSRDSTGETEMCSPVSVSERLRGYRVSSDPEAVMSAAIPTPSPIGESIQPATRRARRESTATALNFSCLNLVCPIDADGIRNRWLNSYLPVPGQTLKTLPTNVPAFTLRILKSYAAIAVRGHGIPPFYTRHRRSTHH